MATDLSCKLHTLLKSEGASIEGFADLRELASEARNGLPFGVSFGVALNRHIVAEMTEGPTMAYVEECLRLDTVLDGISQRAVEMLSAYGFNAKRQATTNIVGTQYPPNFATPLPHKTVATKAGLGWIGKCALLVTPQFGAALRLGSILSDAPLAAEMPIEQSKCGSCSECKDICPAHAICGTNWEAGMPRDSLVDVTACRETARDRLVAKIGQEVVGRTFCGMCFIACPWTKKYMQKTP
jgi:epoxyqueuosine reductase QueG